MIAFFAYSTNHDYLEILFLIFDTHIYIYISTPLVPNRERRYTGTEDGEYGRRYIEASVRERERTGRGSGEYGRRRRGDSVDYEYRRSKREEWRR